MGSKKWILGGVVLFAVLLIAAAALVLLAMQSGKAIREEIAHADVGYTVTFGDAEWLVAGIEGDRTLLVREHCLAPMPFDYELSGGAVASYFPSNNCIYICEDAELEDKQSEDYIVAVHETIHAARNTFIEKEDGGLVCVTFSEIPENTIGYANYQDEALVSWFACQLQNEGKPSQSYAYLSSMYRQFMPYLEYDGADYINHSAGCFIEALQKEFDACGVGYNALSVFNLLDALMRSHEDGAIPVECSDYAALFDALSQIRQHHIGYEQMDAAAREEAFAEFWADLMLFTDPETTRFPEITEDSYRHYWN